MDPQPIVTQTPQPIPPMKNNLNTMLVIAIYSLLLVVLTAAVTYLFVRSNVTNNVASNPTSSTASTTSTSTNITGSTASTTTSATSSNVTVYFYQGPLTPNTAAPLVSVQRSTAATDLYKFALDQLITGPNSSEQTLGYLTTVVPSGTSNCGGDNYKLTRSGATLTVQWCKQLDTVMDTTSGGAYAGATLNAMSRTRAEIKKTLTFGSVTKVAVRDQNGQCYAPDVEDPDCTD